MTAPLRPGLLFVSLLLLAVPTRAFSQGGRVSAPSGAGAGSTGAPAPDKDPCLLDAQCTDHYQRARNFSKAGEYQTALEEYQLAFKRQPVSWLLLNIARTLHKLGKLPEAIDKYQRFLDITQNGAPELRAKAQESLDQAKKELAERPPPPPTPPPIPPPTPPPPTVSEPPPAPLVAPPTPNFDPTAANKDAPPAARPVYKKWWFWTAIGGVVVAGAVVGVVVGTRSSAPADPSGIVIHDQHF